MRRPRVGLRRADAPRDLAPRAGARRLRRLVRVRGRAALHAVLSRGLPRSHRVRPDTLPAVHLQARRRVQIHRHGRLPRRVWAQRFGAPHGGRRPAAGRARARGLRRGAPLPLRHALRRGDRQVVPPARGRLPAAGARWLRRLPRHLRTGRHPRGRDSLRPRVIRLPQARLLRRPRRRPRPRLLRVLHQRARAAHRHAAHPGGDEAARGSPVLGGHQSPRLPRPPLPVHARRRHRVVPLPVGPRRGCEALHDQAAQDGWRQRAHVHHGGGRAAHELLLRWHTPLFAGRRPLARLPLHLQRAARLHRRLERCRRGRPPRHRRRRRRQRWRAVAHRPPRVQPTDEGGATADVDPLRRRVPRAAPHVHGDARPPDGRDDGRAAVGGGGVAARGAHLPGRAVCRHRPPRAVLRRVERHQSFPAPRPHVRPRLSQDAGRR
mmetsp:Transcript_58229/g.173101  ORF Transcript_58229/g.173101 Transcript_58229/m.173101 type:complete len:435 (-) Transcript_58229:636-1940(-)